MSVYKEKLTSGVIDGLGKGWDGFVWLLKILIPISLLTFLLDYSGWLVKFDVVMIPVMKLLSLPPQAVIPIFTGMLTGVYGTIASMAVLSLSMEQMTLVAIFVLISHNLIQEGIIQGRSGLNPIKATLFRLTTSMITVIIVARFMDSDTAATLVPVAFDNTKPPILLGLKDWCISIFYLSGVIFIIIMALMVLLETMMQLNWIVYIIKVLDPILKLLGLDGRVGMLWLTAVFFGLSYGAVVIVQEAKEGYFSQEELERLHLSIGINHSMIEDPALFLALGLSAFWLWIPRLLAAVVAVYFLKLWYKTGIANRVRTTGKSR